jgi:hypothetical protein
MLLKEISSSLGGTTHADIYNSLSPMQFNMLKKISQNIVGDQNTLSPKSREIVDSLYDLKLIDLANRLTPAGERVLTIATRLGTVDSRKAIKATNRHEVDLDDFELE